MIDMLIAFAKRLLMLLPFLLLVRSNYKANLKKPVRYKQFLMPVVSLVLCIVAMVFLQRIYDWMLELLLALPEWLRQLQLWLADVLPAALAVIPDLVGKFTQRRNQASRTLLSCMQTQMRAHSKFHVTRIKCGTQSASQHEY